MNSLVVRFLHFGVDPEAQAEARQRLVDQSFPGAQARVTIVDDTEPTFDELALMFASGPQVVEINANPLIFSGKWHHSTMAYFLLVCEEKGIPVIEWTNHRPMNYHCRFIAWDSGSYISTLESIGVMPRHDSRYDQTKGN